MTTLFFDALDDYWTCDHYAKYRIWTLKEYALYGAHIRSVANGRSGITGSGSSTATAKAAPP